MVETPTLEALIRMIPESTRRIIRDVIVVVGVSLLAGLTIMAVNGQVESPSELLQPVLATASLVLAILARYRANQLSREMENRRLQHDVKLQNLPHLEKSMRSIGRTGRKLSKLNRRLGLDSRVPEHVEAQVIAELDSLFDETQNLYADIQRHLDSVTCTHLESMVAGMEKRMAGVIDHEKVRELIRELLEFNESIRRKTKEGIERREGVTPIEPAGDTGS